MIILNQVKCFLCGDLIFSAHRHDYKSCSCGNISIDGGTDYLKRSFKDKETYEELSLCLPENVVNRCIELTAWAKDSGRNDRGIAYAVIRALHEFKYINNQTLEN